MHSLRLKNINFLLVESTLFRESSVNSIDLFSIYTVKHLLLGKKNIFEFHQADHVRRRRIHKGMPPHTARLFLATSQNASGIQFDDCKLGLLTLVGKEWGAFLRCVL